jgi:hypothetical protein
MDPYLEDPGAWGGVHDALIAILREQLNRRLGSDFIADGATSVYIITPDEQRWIFPDIFVIERTPPPTVTRAGGTIVAPVRVGLAAPARFEQPHIVIRDRASRQIVAVIELLSPINKGPAGGTAPPPGTRLEFLRKRADTMHSSTHWLEIDLLRAGARPAEVRGAGAYYVLLKRAGAGEAEVWPFGLRDPMPVVAVPLTAGHDDVPLDLQAALDALFERYRYAELLDYGQAPPPPPLTLEDARWVTQQLEGWRNAPSHRARTDQT